LGPEIRKRFGSNRISSSPVLQIAKQQDNRPIQHRTVDRVERSCRVSRSKQPTSFTAKEFFRNQISRNLRDLTLFPFRNIDPIFQGLAISLPFGLASSTLLTVLVIPAIYATPALAANTTQQVKESSHGKNYSDFTKLFPATCGNCARTFPTP
jgi:hypothetical protein